MPEKETAEVTPALATPAAKVYRVLNPRGIPKKVKRTRIHLMAETVDGVTKRWYEGDGYDGAYVASRLAAGEIEEVAGG